MNKDSRIYVGGHKGMVGSHILEALQEHGFVHLITRNLNELDLTNQAQTNDFFTQEKPEYVFLAAARVGGILANNTYPADFIRDNLLIQCNVIDAAYRNAASKLLFLGSSCIYPRHAPQPMREEHLLTGPLEPTNEPYAIAKIAGIKMCQAYSRQHGFNTISLMPTNLYGPRDNFDLQNSHVLPAMLRKFHEAKVSGADEVVVWGTGQPKREFLHAKDLAEAAVFLMHNYNDPEIVNVGVGEDMTIVQLAETVKQVVGFEGRIVFDTTKPDGTPRKLLDVSRIFGMGWRPKTSMREGLEAVYRWYLDSVASRLD